MFGSSIQTFSNLLGLFKGVSHLSRHKHIAAALTPEAVKERLLGSTVTRRSDGYLTVHKT